MKSLIDISSPWEPDRGFLIAQSNLDRGKSLRSRVSVVLLDEGPKRMSTDIIQSSHENSTFAIMARVSFKNTNLSVYFLRQVATFLFARCVAVFIPIYIYSFFSLFEAFQRTCNKQNDNKYRFRRYKPRHAYNHYAYKSTHLIRVRK